MSPINFPGADGTGVLIDADTVESVTLAQRRRWWLFGRIIHKVTVHFRNEPHRRAVLTVDSLEAADRVRARIENAMLS